jgi:D-arabinose 1-dehydrogenase-like Zn-dependent alcohol dehydrogenase
VFGQKKLVGSIVGGRSDMDGMFRLAAAKGVKPLIEVWPSAKVLCTELHCAGAQWGRPVANGLCCGGA